MAIKAQIIILHESDAMLEKIEDIEDELQLNIECEDIFLMVTAIPNVEIINTIIIRPVKIIVTKKLLVTCTYDEPDVIFITGNVELTERHHVNIVNEAIKIVANRKILSNKLINLILKIETKLESITNYRTVCGIRNKTLIINLSGPYEDKEKCLTTITDMMLNTINIIREDTNLTNPLISIASSSDNSSEKRKDKDANKNLGESSSNPLHLSFTENTNYNANNRYKELFPMISIEDALNILREVTNKNENKPVEIIKISNAYDRILCENIQANNNVPSFRASSKHGYAVLVADGNGFRKVLNGKNKFPPVSLQPGTCVWVKSRAPVPDEATAVIAVKDTKPVKKSKSDDDTYIEIMIKPQHGQNIKPIGYDLRKGKIVIKKYTRIGPEEIGILVASGCEEVIVSSKLSIGVLSIGDNLQEPGEPLKSGYIYDINRISLISLLKHNSFSSLDFGIVNNKFSSILDKIKKVLEKVDVLVTTGSVNDKDLLKEILTKYFEATIHFGNVNMKPGKSTTLATCKINNKTKYLLCLSGNPISAFIAAQIFLLPLLNEMCCNFNSDLAVIPVHVDSPFILHPRPRLAWTYLKWSEEENFARAFDTSNLLENKLYSTMGSNALLILPEKKKTRDTQVEQVIQSETNFPALIVGYPRKFDHLLPKCLNFQ